MNGREIVQMYKTDSIAHLKQEAIANSLMYSAKKLKEDLLQSLLFRGFLLWTICTYRAPSIFAQHSYRCSEEKIRHIPCPQGADIQVVRQNLQI